MSKDLNKKYFFMSGLPRCGTTLLSSIFSQNPATYLSPQSELSEYLRIAHQNLSEAEDLGVMKENKKSLMKNIIPSYYSSTDKKYIIDKCRRWGNPYFVNLLLENLDDKIKILCPSRPLTEVISSFIVKAEENPDKNYIDRKMISEDFLPYWRKPINDARVDWLLKPGGLVDTSILSMHSAIFGAHKEMFYVFSYNELIKNPNDTMTGIYDFLEIEAFSHDFNEIPREEPHNDEEVLGIPDLHSVRPKLLKISKNPEEVLSEYAIKRCELEDFWTKTS